MKKKLTALFAVLCLLWALSLPVLAADSPYIYDEADLLTDMEEQALLTTIESVAQTYECGVYVVTVENFWQYGDSPYSAAVELYIRQMTGGGVSDNGILLLLSMSERDYSILTYGSEAEAVFTDRTLSAIEENFLKCFRYDLWYEGFARYVSDCESEWDDYTAVPNSAIEKVFEESAASVLVEEVLDRASYYNSTLWLIVTVVSCVISLVVCLVMRAGMRTARWRAEATEYIEAGGVQLHVKQDRFTHTTRQVIHHPKSNGSSGGGSRGGGGFRGHSGKF